MSDEYDCGAWAAHKNCGIDMRPNYDDLRDTVEWNEGYVDYESMDEDAVARLILRKKGA